MYSLMCLSELKFLCRQNTINFTEGAGKVRDSLIGKNGFQ